MIPELKYTEDWTFSRKKYDAEQFPIFHFNELPLKVSPTPNQEKLLGWDFDIRFKKIIMAREPVVVNVYDMVNLLILTEDFAGKIDLIITCY